MILPRMLCRVCRMFSVGWNEYGRKGRTCNSFGGGSGVSCTAFSARMKIIALTASASARISKPFFRQSSERARRTPPFPLLSLPSAMLGKILADTLNATGLLHALRAIIADFCNQGRALPHPITVAVERGVSHDCPNLVGFASFGAAAHTR